MTGKNSLIDADFLEDEDDENQFSTQYDDIDIDEQPAAKADADGLEVEIVDDTPEKDKGKWVADDERDGKPDLPTEDEVKGYSQDVQKRISKMTARLHAERRAKEELLRQHNELVKFSETLVKRSNQLSELVENGEKVLVHEHKSRLESQMQAAKTAFREAQEAGDTTGMLAAQENMAKTAAALDRLSVHRVNSLPRTDENQFRQTWQQQQQQPQVDERTSRWLEKNGWFGRDTVMTAFAMGIHADLDKRGIGPQDPRYWKTVDGEVQKRFPERFERPQAPRRQSPVAPANRVSGGGEGKKVTLTESQVRLARRLGLTPEQYARQLVKEQHKD